MVADAAWVFPFVSSGEVQHKQHLIKQGVHTVMVSDAHAHIHSAPCLYSLCLLQIQLLSYAPHIAISAVRTLGNFVAASQELADVCLQV